jgi:hypothetical protein
MNISRRNFIEASVALVGASALPWFIPPAFSMEVKQKCNVNFGPSKFNTANFPDRDLWLKNVTYVRTIHLPKTGCRTLMISELWYTVQGVSGIRQRRCFVVQSYQDDNLPTMKPILLAAFPGSSVVSGVAGGATDLWNYPAGAPNIEFDWPLQVVRKTGIYAVLIDPPGYGMNSYVPTNAYDGMIDHISGIDAALWWISSPVLQWYPTIKTYLPNTPPLLRVSPKLILGGLSYGAITTSFMAGLLPDAYGAYMSGAYLVKATQAFSYPSNQPEFYPADWGGAKEWDYTDMLLTSNIKKVSVCYGWNNEGIAGSLPSDYARINSNWSTTLIDASSAKLIADSRFNVDILTTTPTIQGHEINMTHLQSKIILWIDDIIATL